VPKWISGVLFISYSKWSFSLYLFNSCKLGICAVLIVFEVLLGWQGSGTSYNVTHDEHLNFSRLWVVFLIWLIVGKTLHVNVILSTLYSILTVYYSRVVLHVVFRETFIKDSQTQGSNPNKGDNPPDEQKSLTATVKVKERQEHWCSHHNRSHVQRLNCYFSLHLLIYMLRDVIRAVVHNRGTFHMDQSFWRKHSQN
jgi:hypothetical protein